MEMPTEQQAGQARHDSRDDLWERDSAAMTGTRTRCFCPPAVWTWKELDALCQGRSRWMSTTVRDSVTSQVTSSIVTFSAGLGCFERMDMTLRSEIWWLDKQIFRLAPPCSHR